jgi:hypothetical protein
MSGGLLPADGEPVLGSVRLPFGTRIPAAYGTDEPVAWVTARPVADAGRIWLALSGMIAQTVYRFKTHRMAPDLGVRKISYAAW